MVRFGGKLGWSALLATLMFGLLQNAAAQSPGTAGQMPAAQNRQPIPQNASPPVASQAQPAATPASQSTHHKKSHTRQKVEEPQVAQAPAAPPTLEQMPPSPPRVSYTNGELSISAHNSTLAQVLRAVQAQTGASVDIPGSASGERVVAEIGPGTPQKVLATLLNGSHFNYVIMGVAGGGGGVQKVILTNRQNGGPSTSVQANNRQPPPAAAGDETTEEDQAATFPDSDIPTNTPLVPQPGRPGVNEQPGDQPAADNNDPNQQNGVKTPEQLLQELQRMQQQQQQYQQQLNPANRQPPEMPSEPQQPQ